MTAIAEDVLAGLPQDWESQVARAYTVLAAPSPFRAATTLDEAYAVEPFFSLHGEALAAGDDYGATWLELRALDDLTAALDGEDELGLGRWLERLHPRGEGGLFREIRGRRLANRADEAVRTRLLTGNRGPEGGRWRNFVDKMEERPPKGEPWETPSWEGPRQGEYKTPGRPDERMQPWMEGKWREERLHVDAMRAHVQQMVDDGVPLREIRKALGLDDRRVRKAAEDAMQRHQQAIEDRLDQVRSEIGHSTDPDYTRMLQEEYRWLEGRLGRQVYRRQQARPAPEPAPEPRRPPLSPAERIMQQRLEQNRANRLGRTTDPSLGLSRREEIERMDRLRARGYDRSMTRLVRPPARV
jgi:DNA-binding transcriptional MerR regulator